MTDVAARHGGEFLLNIFLINFILDSSSGQPLHDCESKRYAIFTACSSNQAFLHHEQAKSSIDWFYFTFEIIIILIIVFIVHFPVLTLQHFYFL